MHDIIFSSINFFLQGVKFFLMNANEVTTMNNKQWISVHVYVMKDWC
jgi:hypothetical protein